MASKHEFYLDGLVMRAVETDPSGVVNHETLFTFSQSGDRVSARYSGGLVEDGFLVGVVRGGRLTFRYCQRQTDGTLDGGQSECELERVKGLLRLNETFEWSSRPGSGRNIIEEVPDPGSGDGSWLGPAPRELRGETARLLPLRHDLAEGLLEAGNHEAIWRHLPLDALASLDEVHRWIDEAGAEEALGTTSAYAIAVGDPPHIVGSTRFLNARAGERLVEIGYTWITPAHQRTRVNTECKLLLLRRAFGELGARCVEFKTDLRNEPSQRALERIGAVRGRVLRNHRVGAITRDSVFFEIWVERWPEVERHLTRLLEQGSGD